MLSQQVTYCREKNDFEQMIEKRIKLNYDYFI
jgi:hypothetical protein